MFKLRFKIRRSTKKINEKVIKRTLGALLIASGVLLVLTPPIYKAYEEKFSQEEVIKVAEESDDPIDIDKNLLKGERRVEEEPKRIIIPSKEIDLKIKAAEVKRGKWEVFEDIPSYGIGSGIPGNKGNTVIFAHARKGLFLPLKDIQKDNEILIFTNEKWFSYKVTEIKEVNPKDVSVITPTEDETLTLYTCSGFADSKRLIVIAKRVNLL